MKFLAVKDFAKYQHYKDRNPPWIKLYGGVLRDATFLQMPEAAQAQLIKLWLLASQLGHPLPNNPRFLAGKIGTTGKFHLATLTEAGFILPCEQTETESASKDSPEMLAEGHQENDENAIGSVCAGAGSRERTEEEEREERTDTSSSTSAGDFCNALITACNQGMRANPKIGDAYTPIPHGHARSLEATDDLLRSGVDLEYARSWVFENSKRYTPNGRSRQVTSLMYFRDGLLEAWDAHRAALAAQNAEAPKALPALSQARNGKYPPRKSAAEQQQEIIAKMTGGKV